MKKSDIQKEKILEVAQDLFVKKGFEATTTREINRAVGISDGSLYYYFPDGKKQILDLIVQKGMVYREQYVRKIQATAIDLDDFEKLIIKIYQGVCNLFSDEEGYRSFMITIRERAILSNNQSKWIAQILDRLKAGLTKNVKSIQEFTKIASDDEIDSLTDMIVSILQRSIYEELIIKNRREISQDIRTKTLSQIHLLIQLIKK
ncbi:TetR/AcrR family transcriptional regulator [Companilactobacillus huachuanensis]|uniref:TetR/AcrR family transcriptional regulator n=1 Tax=Companilactobacillus huachuanensis TaxID=2559914 RepID=A0ABW1RQ20_9LACO|nr:TetR/AcrR family transcriptional regulator [Companilactobacillus huachuanensis]